MHCLVTFPFYGIFALFATSTGGESEKRLLLNNISPDTISSMQALIQSMQVKMNDMETKFVDMDRQHQQNITALRTLFDHLITALTSEVSALKAKLNTAGKGGAVFVRWGRKECPGSDNELVYSGYIGGTYYDIQGPSNPQCMTPDPILSNRTYSANNHVFGAEFDHDFFGSGTRTEDLTCAVCRSTKFTSLLTIPGRNLCYNGWTMLYSGYLLAGHKIHKGAMDYTCFDSAPEYLVGGANRDYGALFYMVSAQCGSLECPPYQSNKIVTCAVCAK